MIGFLYIIFIKYGAIVPLCILLGAYVIKHYIPAFPDKLIPIVNIIVSVLCLIFWSPLIKAPWPLNLRIFNGVLYGFAATGIHQTWKQLRAFFRIKKYRKQIIKERENR